MDHFLDKSYGKAGFDAAVAPALRIEPGTGAVIGFETDDAVYAQLHERGSLDKVTAQINPITGPVYVEGAEPGDTLAVTIHAIDFIDHGWSVYLPGVGALAGRMGSESMTRSVPITRDGQVALTESLTVPAQPMIGCMGVAPATGVGSTVMPSYAYGGNMDLTDAKPGSTVYLPVQVPGALLSIGDLHAIMARGESSFVAIEAQGTAHVSIELVKGGAGGARVLRAPRVDTGEEMVFVGLGDPVQQSINRGYEDMYDFLVEDHGWSGADAYVVMSALAHSELGGPTGSIDPDPLHPMTAVGAVTVHRLPTSIL
ncbi:acetamidase/formamidase family protein [Demetria terragena]|uniref:acetamidase/formamidase family protein n=1 Tax=Demetria terragena TaxID=63959 RepID=UPI00037C12BF|nr:acetamidase/formamidase family protein [Demetria terragena]